jgi:hypothetical protein
MFPPIDRNTQNRLRYTTAFDGLKNIDINILKITATVG